MRRWMMGPALAVAALTALACNDAPDPLGPTGLDVRAEGPVARGPSKRTGAVYLMTNAAGANEVIVFRRAADGSLAREDDVPTGGMGTGSGLGNQSAVVLTEDGRWLLVVNPGSDDVSVFAVTPSGLELADREPSGGMTPISLAVHGRLVYVLDGEVGSEGISGFWLDGDGSLHPISGSTRPLSGTGVGPAQVGFSPDGGALVVTEKGTSSITTYQVGADGRASAPVSTSSAGTTPFGFAFDRDGHLIVSEAATGTVSSYRIAADGAAHLIDGPVPTNQAAACWIAVSGDSRFAYTTNAGSGSISGYLIGPRGGLDLLDADGRTGVTGEGSTPLDADFSQGGRYLYVLSAGTHEVSAFERQADGGLLPMDGASDLPGTANGMAAW